MILKTWALALLLLCFTPAEAQSLFGYLSYDAALKAMPEYTLGQAELQRLRSQYADEMKRVEEEFNSKYEDFLEVQRELAPTILNKRQSELQQLMERNMQFKQQAQEELQQAEKRTMETLQQKLDTLLQTIGKERNYAFILNTDNHACPYINPAMGDDLTDIILQRIHHQ
jgi:outer membrane protein